MAGVDKGARDRFPDRLLGPVRDHDEPELTSVVLDALDHDAARVIGTEPEPVADREVGLAEWLVRQRHLALLADDGLASASELAFPFGWEDC